MLESIMIGCGFFAIGALTSLILISISLRENIINRSVESNVFKYKLPNGKSIHFWRGFVFPDRIYVYTCNKDDELDGDGVIFNEEGDIISVDKHEKG